MARKLEKLDDASMEAVAGGKYVGSVFQYTVQAGDSLSMLAMRFGTTVKTLSELNGIQDARSIQPGIRILIPLRA